MSRRSLRAGLTTWRLRRGKDTGDLSGSFEAAARLEVDGRPDPTPPRRTTWGLVVSRRVVHDSVVIVLRPRGGTPHRAVLYVHGGGYVDDINPGAWAACARLARATGAEVWVVAYRLAPRQTAGTTVPQVRAVYEQLVSERSPDAVAVLGDSAGGGLALAVLQDAVAREVPAPALLALVSPWVDVTLPDPDVEGAEARDVMLDRGRLLAAGLAYAGDLDPTDPRVSPVNGPMTGLPPVWITAAGDDALVYQGRRLRDALVAGGVPVTYREDPAMMHVHAFFPVPEGRRAIAPVVAAIRDLPGPSARATRT
ncbi:alpha/beta hydrolase fold domain-containing protein [Aquipuribacter sp. MA13-6]|uniref:alpha/beta hydrolase fold domain-containing protein n=1 Tax=unclassified Aquipuribacter TaxID=2635084 RepID=UPI003EF01EC8